MLGACRISHVILRFGLEGDGLTLVVGFCVVGELVKGKLVIDLLESHVGLGRVNQRD